MNYRRKAAGLIVCGILILSRAMAQTAVVSTEVKAAMYKVSADEIKAQITYLADDKLKGRMPGTPGYQMAVDYVVSQLKALGVKPAGESGGWLQTVRLRKAITTDATFSISNQTSQMPVANSKLLIVPNPIYPDLAVKANMTFAGYGISEPNLGYDDYAGIDVKGKVVVIVRGAPAEFASSVAAHSMNTSTILKNAAMHGAVGVILSSADTANKTVPDISKGSYSVLDENGNVVVSRSYYSSQIKLLANIPYPFLDRLVRAVNKSTPTILSEIKSGRPQSFALDIDVNARYTSVYQDIKSYNIIGKIEGSDPRLKNEYVVHSAHLDHLGIGTPVQGDSIYNGAHDNASGVASLLGIAKVYANIKIKPKRSILVVMVTGEEMGDLGSGYFAKHPTVPVSSMVADVNTDMPTIIAPLLSITALGAEHSSLSKQVDQAAGYLGISVEPDPEPKQARFTRSDQYSFVLQGIPALHVKYGTKTADGKNNLSDMVGPWRAKYYHKPQDDINGIFDFNAGKKYAQLNFLIGYLVAQDVKRPVWNEGDIFAGNGK
jgi:hypothetical protein